MSELAPASDRKVVETICALNWRDLSKTELIDTAWAYYFFSIQFRENLQIARGLYPEDMRLEQLHAEECDTANLSPYPDVADDGERMDHDEFMRRLLALTPIDETRLKRLCAYGDAYLAAVRQSAAEQRALSMVSYEGGGLESVFRAMLTAPDWSDPLLHAFRHFLRCHLQLDDYHGALVKHMRDASGAAPLWVLFKDLLVRCVPRLEDSVLPRATGTFVMDFAPLNELAPTAALADNTAPLEVQLESH